MQEQLKLVHKAMDVVECPKTRICVTLLRYKVNNAETSYAQVRLLGRETEEENFQQIVYVNYKLDGFVYLVDVRNSVYDKVNANQTHLYCFMKSNGNYLLQSFTLFIRVSQDELEHWR